MRFVMSGGSWKNTEDEILKAAVMKYGKNQWARISSLLVRKSAKQCKARWYEWLDPSIKKTEWSREEEEKLLHLAKLMPCQWRSIAPIVGRTAAQCLEHYEKLLDAASNRAVDPMDDPRRLRPGEIDPQPETKPARPDAVDMDEDVKEMLSEARARLANTQGKKAKRKAREKQLDEARRLALLQKRREQKMAGVSVSRRRRDPRRDRIEINYNKEIPFKKSVPSGLHDVSNELDRQHDQKFQEIERKRIDGVRRKLEEKKQADRDKQKMAKKKKDSLPDAIAQLNRAIDPSSTFKRRRTKLSLPRPMLDEDELERVAKATAAAQRDNERLASSRPATGRPATGQLLGNYAATPGGATPMRGVSTSLRTPRAGVSAEGIPQASRAEMLLQEAQKLAALENAETPLLGGESVALTGSDFSGVTPARRELRTPNVLATPARLQTPGGVQQTPIRDALSINTEEPDAPESMAAAAAAARRQAMELRGALSLLPAPSNEYELVAPEEPAPMDLSAQDDLEEDAADRAARLAKHEREMGEKELQRCSASLRRELPRPLAVGKKSKKKKETSAAAQMVADEMRAMLVREHCIHPPSKSKPATKALRNEYAQQNDELLQDIGLDNKLISKAHDLLDTERRILLGKKNEEQGKPAPAVPDALASLANYRDHLEAVSFDPRAKAAVRVNKDTKTAVTAVRLAEAELAQMRAKQARARVEKLAKRTNLLHKGYLERAEAMLADIKRARASMQQAAVQLGAFESLAAYEARAIVTRRENGRERVAAGKQREQRSQARYQALVDQREAVLAGDQDGALAAALAAREASEPVQADDASMAVDDENDAQQKAAAAAAQKKQAAAQKKQAAAEKKRAAAEKKKADADAKKAAAAKKKADAEAKKAAAKAEKDAAAAKAKKDAAEKKLAQKEEAQAEKKTTKRKAKESVDEEPTKRARVSPAKKSPKRKKAAAKGDGDDLTVIEGVGKVLAGVMTKAGYDTYAAVAAATADELRGVLEKANKRYRSHNPETWPDQAAMARDGKFEELEKWQDELDGGRKKKRGKK